MRDKSGTSSHQTKLRTRRPEEESRRREWIYNYDVLKNRQWVYEGKCTSGHKEEWIIHRKDPQLCEF